MKKLIYVSAALILLALTLPASPQRCSIGLVGGLNFSEMESNYDIELSGMTVYGIGGVVDISLSNNFILHIEPMYLQRGSELGILEPFIDFSLKSTFIEVPLFLKAEFGSSIRPYFYAGPTIGFLLSSDININILGLNLTYDVKDLTESINFGIGFGVGLRVPLSSCSIFVEGRYTVGLTDMLKMGSIGIELDYISEELEIGVESWKYTNRGVQLMCGISVPVGR